MFTNSMNEKLSHKIRRANQLRLINLIMSEEGEKVTKTGEIGSEVTDKLSKQFGIVDPEAAKRRLNQVKGR